MFYYYLVAFLILVLIGYRYWRQNQFLDLKRRHVLITGCATGFGNMLAKHLDQLGVPVYAGCINQSAVDLLKQETSSRLKAFVLDVTKQDSIDRMVEFVSKDLDGKPLWAMVNNAAIPAPVVPFDWSDIQDYTKVLDVNLLGTIRATLAFLPLIKQGREGRIVNISSINGRFNIASNAYGISKWGLEALSDGLSIELKPFNITVHTLQPGLFKTNITNPDNLCQLIREKWDALSPQVKSEYGEEFLEGRFLFVRTLTKQGSANFSPVVDAHMHALFAQYPHNRYLVGWNAMTFLPITYLPFPLQAAAFPLLLKLMGVSNPPPKCAISN